LNYTVEQVLDHTIDWVNKMIEIIAREEFERNIFELSLHGVDKNAIENMRTKFNNQIDSVKGKQKAEQESLTALKRLGISVGKKRSTKVINR